MHEVAKTLYSTFYSECATIYGSVSIDRGKIIQLKILIGLILRSLMFVDRQAVAGHETGSWYSFVIADVSLSVHVYCLHNSYFP